MRIILYTGKGGVGKTSIAAATAVRIAKGGKKTLVVSTDPAHSLGDSFDIRLRPEPEKIMENLWGQEIDAVHETEKGWGKMQAYLRELFASKTIDDITTEELTAFPGLEDLLSLLRILHYYKEKAYDVVIVDCAPTGETLAFLSFPEMLKWWMERIFPIQRKAVKIVRPFVEPLLGMPLPSDDVMKEIEKLYGQLDEMKQILSDREVTSVRIVVNPEKMVIKEAQRSFTYLNIYDFNVDAVIMNRVIPENVSDSYFKMWKDIQKKYKELIEENFSPVPVYNVPLFEQEIVGMEMLERIGEQIFGSEEPSEIKYNQRTQQVSKNGGEYNYSIYMPFVQKSDISLNQKGDEVIVKVGNVKRSITLPRSLMGLEVKGARFEGDTLIIRFGGNANE